MTPSYAIRWWGGAELVLRPVGNETPDRFVYDRGGEITQAILDRTKTGAHLRLFRSHALNRGDVCFYTAEKSGDVEGRYVQCPRSAYNLEIGHPEVEVVSVNAPAHPTEEPRAAAAKAVCEGCDQFRGMKSRYVVDCASGSCRPCGGVPLLRGQCPKGKWWEPLMAAGHLKPLDVRVTTPPAIVRQLLEGPIAAWPAGWEQWNNVKAAHRTLFYEFACRLRLDAEPGRSRGIVIVGGGAYFASLYVTVRVLRHVGCKLPVEVWYFGDKGEISDAQKRALAGYDVRFVDADQHARANRPRIFDGWGLKPYAVAFSSFAEVLSLDADCYPVRDPSYLFDSPEYQAHGAAFWPDDEFHDLGQGKWTGVWETFGMAHRVERGFESGQFMVHRGRCWREMALTRKLNEHSDFVYKHVWGDKETFHLAWRMLGSEYAMPSSRWRQSVHTLVQHGFEGRVLFQHRCRDKFTVDPKKGDSQFSVFTTTPQSDLQGNLLKANTFNPELEHEQFCFDCVEELRKLLA